MLHLRLYLTAVLLVSTCGSAELCQGDSKCTTCTVTGRSVIDIKGMVDFAADRCAYTLMSTTSIPDFQVQAKFKERRRKDVYFLDSVILSGSKALITLEQGGVVQLDGVPMQLTAKAQLVHGVELSKDQTGVTAKKSDTDYAMTVFFDGYTAQIHIKGPSGQTPSVEGLCANSLLPFIDSRLSKNEPGCETPHKDTADSTIDCKKMTERCNLLSQAPFSACQSYVNANPYVTACTDTLCKYPATDGLDCQFLEAYARACSLHSDGILDGWRSKANCVAGPKAFCQDRFCSTDEFCGENSQGTANRCHCRAIFADPYRTKKAVGDAVVCDKSSRSVSLVACLLEDRGISYSDLQLYDNTCRGEMDKVTHRVKLGFDTKTKPCGTMIKMNSENKVINKNAVIVGSTSEELTDFSCPFVIPDININFSMNIKVKSGISDTTVAYVTSGVWKYTLTMKAFTDAGLTQAVTPATPLRLNQKVWVELKTHGVDRASVTLVTNGCYATNEPSPTSTLTYNLITKGCANRADTSVKLEGSGQGTSNVFSFTLFRFIGKNQDVYLHCKLRLCDKQIETCVPDCSQPGRRRRAPARRSPTHQYKEQNQTSIVMAWGS